MVPSREMMFPTILAFGSEAIRSRIRTRMIRCTPRRRRNAPAYALAMLLGLVSVAHAAEKTAASPPPSRDKYMVQAGDELEVSVWKEADLQRDVLVQPDGSFSFPLIGEVDAGGRTIASIRDEIKGRLEKYIPDLVVTVLIKNVQGNRIYVIGEVKNPGAYVMNPNVNVIQALSLAGGITAFADQNGIRIIRNQDGKEVAIPFSYSDVSKGRDLKQNIVLQAGDVVSVP